MIQIVLHRSLLLVIACSDGVQWERGDTSHGWQDKSPDIRPGHVVGWIESFMLWGRGACWRPYRKVQRIQRIERRRPLFCRHRSL
jgi:hypothetical protein